MTRKKGTGKGRKLEALVGEDRALMRAKIRLLADYSPPGKTVGGRTRLPS